MKDNIKEGYKDSVLGEIPVDWEVVKLGEVFEIARGGSPRPINEFLTSDSNGYNWIKIGDTKGIDKYIYKTKQKIIKKGLKKSVLVKEDDFILSNSMSFGKPYIMKTTGCIHDGWLVLRRKNEELSIDFMYYFLSSEIIKTQFKSKAAGSTVQNLNIKLVNTVSSILPTFKEQKKIAEILCTVDEKIDIVEQNIKETKELKKGLMQKLLTKGINHSKFKDSPLGQIPDSWEVVKLGEVCEKVTDGSHFSPIPQCDTGYYIATVKDMGKRSFDKSYVSISKSDFEALGNNGCKPMKGDVLFSKDGTIGKTFVYDETLNIVLLSSVAIIRVISEEVYPYFVCEVLKSPVFYNQLKGLKSGSAIKRLVLKAIKEIKIPILPLQEQKQIAEILTGVDDKIDVLEKKKLEHQDLKKGLMQQLLTGKTRVFVS